MPTVARRPYQGWGSQYTSGPTSGGSYGYQGGRQVQYLPGGGFVDVPQPRSQPAAAPSAMQFTGQQIGQAANMARNPTMAPTPSVNPQTAAYPPAAQPIPFQSQMGPDALLSLLGAPTAMPYGSGAWNMLSSFGTGQATIPQPSQITTGISQPNVPAPMAGQMPGGFPSGVDPRAVQANLAQFLQPMQAESMGRYYSGMGGLSNAFQQAQSNAGLGWASMIPQMGQLRNAQQGNLLNFLAGLR